MSEKIFEIEFVFYSGRNPRSFWKCGGCMRVCVWIEIVATTVFCSAKAQFWMISEAILIPKNAILQEIASNFSKFSGGGLAFGAWFGASPPFQNSWICPWLLCSCEHDCPPVPCWRHVLIYATTCFIAVICVIYMDMYLHVAAIDSATCTTVYISTVIKTASYWWLPGHLRLCIHRLTSIVPQM